MAVANGKEISALAIQGCTLKPHRKLTLNTCTAAAEAESILATAERAKAILPLCVGLSTTASAFALLAPAFVQDLSNRYGISVVKEIYLFFPLIAVLGAAIAGLASQEASSLCTRASGVGNRRFASSGAVGRTWLSATEQVELMSERTSKKWKSFSTAVFVAPIISIMFPGTLSFKGIICAAVAAAQAAYYLTNAEYALSAATEAVALKSRAAAIADTYANQGSRAGAVLPFTSALAGLCAAASAAAVEFLPLISMVELQSVISCFFPAGAALFAAAASVSKARCEVDASAASSAAATGMTGELYNSEGDPFTNVIKLILTSVQTAGKRIKVKVYKLKMATQEIYRSSMRVITQYRIKLRLWLSRKGDGDPNSQISTSI